MKTPTKRQMVVQKLVDYTNNYSNNDHRKYRIEEALKRAYNAGFEEGKQFNSKVEERVAIAVGKILSRKPKVNEALVKYFRGEEDDTLP